MYSYSILSPIDLWNAEMDIRRILRCERNQCPVLRTAAYQQVRISALYHRRPISVIAGPFRIQFQDDTLTVSWLEPPPGGPDDTPDPMLDDQVDQQPEKRARFEADSELGDM